VRESENVKDDHLSPVVVNSLLATGFGAISAEALTYAEKMLSVLVLAVVAECGRRLVSKFWKGGKS
jgi:hypothetical protein